MRIMCAFYCLFFGSVCYAYLPVFGECGMDKGAPVRVTVWERSMVV